MDGVVDAVGARIVFMVITFEQYVEVFEHLQSLGYERSVYRLELGHCDECGEHHRLVIHPAGVPFSSCKCDGGAPVVYAELVEADFVAPRPSASMEFWIDEDGPAG